MRSGKKARREVEGVGLVRLGPGRYTTVDGRFLIERAGVPSTGWRLDDRYGDDLMVGSLKAAAREVAGVRSGSGSTPPVGADTPPVPAGGVVPGPDGPEGGDRAGGRPPTTGGSPSVARLLHPSCGGSYREVAEQIADDTILLIAANAPETLATIARSSIETPHPAAPDLSTVMVHWRTRVQLVYTSAATFFENRGDR